MTDAQRAKEWLMQNGYWVTMIVRKKWLVMERDTKAQDVFKTDAELIAFARSKGWGGEG